MANRTPLRIHVTLGAALFLAGAVRAQQGRGPSSGMDSSQPTSQTLTIGERMLRLGMQKEAVVSALETQYNLVASDSTGLDASLGHEPQTPVRRYLIMANKSDLVGWVDFSEQGQLVRALKTWTPGEGPHSEGEIGRALYTLLANMASDAKAACFVEASKRDSAGPAHYVSRVAAIRCGVKRILVGVITSPDGSDSTSIDEEIDTENGAK